MIKQIVLCADDFGQSKAISDGILDLLSAKRLSATSCMVNGDDWLRASQHLLSYREQIDLGLHINLTEGRALSPSWRQAYGEYFQGLTRLLLRSSLRQLNQSIVLSEIVAQIQCFKEVMGCLPNMLDGHQHVHQFPVVRDALMQAYWHMCKQGSTYVRLVKGRYLGKNYLANYKKMIIFAMGAKPLERLLNRHSIPHNASFSGIYPFSQFAHYRLWFKRFLQEVNHRGLLMCHPAHADVQAAMPMASSRLCEFKYLLSNDFFMDCSEAGVELKRFSLW